MVEQRSVLAYQSHLGGGGTGVNSQKAVTLIIFKVALFDAVAGVAGLELLIGLLVFKQRLHALYLSVHLDSLRQTADESLGVHFYFLAGVHGRAYSCEQMGVIRSNNLIRPQIQSSDKGGPKLGEEVKRTSQESHVSADRLSAGQAADSLVDNCLKNGGGQIFSGSALIDQRLDV